MINVYEDLHRGSAEGLQKACAVVFVFIICGQAM